MGKGERAMMVSNQRKDSGKEEEGEEDRAGGRGLVRGKKVKGS